jgi:hypothetical protein
MYDPETGQFTHTSTYDPTTGKPDVLIIYNPDGTEKRNMAL